MHRLFFVPDAHHPYVDKKAWAICLSAVAQFKPHILVVLGDFADFHCLSRHRKKPTSERLLRREALGAWSALKELEAHLDDAPRKIFCMGNHEDRLSRYFAEVAPELDGITSAEQLLGLDDTWEVVPYMDHARIGKLHVTHETGKAGAMAHLEARNAFEGCAVIGHTHRMGVHYSGNFRGQTKVGAMFGWLGSVKKAADWRHKIDSHRNSTHGFGIGYMEDNGVVHLQAVPIIRGKACVEGKLIHG